VSDVGRGPNRERRKTDANRVFAINHVVTIRSGEGIYIDANMAHAYLAGEGCDEAVVLGVSWSMRTSLASAALACSQARI